MEKFDTYQIEESCTQRIDLHKNFRSRKEVLESVNYIFKQIMTKDLGGITYDDQAALYPGAEYVKSSNTQTEVLIMDSGLEEWREEKRKAKVSDKELEARMIAKRIRELLKSQLIVDKKTKELRRVRYSDIVILIRSIRGFADIFTEVLNQEGIPTYAGTREGYFAAQEVGIVLDYLRVLDNKKQDIPLAAVLASPIGGFTEEELAIVKSEYKELPFYQAVVEYQKNGTDEKVQEKLKNCMDQIDNFRQIVPYTPMHELLWKILENTGYSDVVSVMPGGEQRHANLEMLVEKARIFEATSYKGLFHFIRYIEQLQKYDVDYGEANIEDEQSDTVQIMTIHKSKGLEFPIVFVAGMGKRFNMQDVRSSVVVHAKMGVGLDAVNLELRTKSPSIIKKVIQKEELLDSLGEELRVLYVALTRAKEKLIITGVVDGLERKLTECKLVKMQTEDALTFGRLSKALTYWDWILPALERLNENIPIICQKVAMEDIVSDEVREEIQGWMVQKLLEEWDGTQIYDPKMQQTIKEQFGYEYSYIFEQTQKLKYTVSELKKRIYLRNVLEEELEELSYEEPEVVPLIPKFLQEEKELTGASRGTAYHRLMELLDYSQKYDVQKLEETVQEFVAKGKMTQSMTECISWKEILQFLNSSFGQRMAKAEAEGKLWREQPFVLWIEARELYPQEQAGELVLVQGIIDVYFEESDGVVVLDYKTDKIYTEEALVERYHAQLDYYARALEQMTKKPVKEKILYSFTINKGIRWS